MQFGLKGYAYFGMADIGGAVIMFGVTYFVGVILVKVQTNSILNFREKLIQSVPLVTYIVMFILNMSNIHIWKPDRFFSILF